MRRSLGDENPAWAASYNIMEGRVEAGAAILVAIIALVIFILRKSESDFARRAERDSVIDPDATYRQALAAAPDEESRLTVVRAEAERVLAQRNEDPMMQAFHALSTFIEKHLDTLWSKKRQLTYMDDYGVERTDRFEAELDYFVSSVIPDRLVQNYAASMFASDAPHECAKLAVQERLKWHNRTMNRRMDEAKARGEAAQSDFQYHPACSGTEFEQLVKANLEAKGFNVRITPASGDQGVDLLAAAGDKTVAVQCKRSGSPIGNKAIQEVAAGRIHYGADEAWVVSDADFTPSARRLAQTNQVKLLNFFAL